jgi:L-fuconolactonase
MEDCGFEGTVAVQARQILEETRWLLELAEHHPFIKGVVGWVDLCDPDLRTHLTEFSSNPLFCGVRTGLRTDPDDDQQLDADFLTGMAVLGDFDTAFDILIRPAQLQIATKLVSRFPEQVFVLDHIANPPIKEQVLEPWAEDIGQLANYTNVYCKVSGMVTRADHDAWQKDDFSPYISVVLNAFGPERLMIGSDWPVCTQATTYQQTMSIVLNALETLPLKQRDAVLGKTAAYAYGLRV